MPEDVDRVNARPTLSVREHCRVVVDNDFAGDPDGLVALAHHLLSPANRVVAITSSFLNPRFATKSDGAKVGARLAEELVGVVGGYSDLPVHVGSAVPFGDNSGSAAAEAIVREARLEDELPLYVVCGGPLTNVATALRDAPEIATRLTVVWIGGSIDGAEFEYNRDTDPVAAELVLGTAPLSVHQFPLETYRRCAYSVAELESDIGGSGRLGAWLWAHFTSPPDWVRIGGVWPFGDSPPLLVTALTVESSTSTTRTTEGGGERRVYTDVDVRLLVGDLLARLRLHEAARDTIGHSHPEEMR